MNSTRKSPQTNDAAYAGLTNQQMSIIDFLRNAPTPLSARRILSGVDVVSDTAAVVADLQHLIEIGLVCTTRDDGPNINYSVLRTKHSSDIASTQSVNSERVNVSRHVRDMLQRSGNPSTIDEIHANVAPEWDRKRVAAIVHTMAAAGKIVRIGTGVAARYTVSGIERPIASISPPARGGDLALDHETIESLISARRNADRALRKRASQTSDPILRELATTAQLINDQIETMVFRILT